MRQWLCVVALVVLVFVLGQTWGQAGMTIYRTTNFHEWWAHVVGKNVLLEVHDHGQVWKGSVDDMLRLMFPPQGNTVDE